MTGTDAADGSGGEGRAIAARFEVVFHLGLHAHPSTVFGTHAAKFAGAVRIERHSPPGEADAKSILQIMMLAAEEGTVLTVCAEGDGAEQFIAGLEDAINAGCPYPVIRRCT